MIRFLERREAFAILPRVTSVSRSVMVQNPPGLARLGHHVQWEKPGSPGAMTGVVSFRDTHGTLVPNGRRPVPRPVRAPVHTTTLGRFGRET